MARKKHQQKQNKQVNTLRIIGGEWRSRKLQFEDAPNLRPTPDRVRETLFNWLQGSIHGARCLDLFAGSGALGLEALSRGAKEVVFVEKVAHVATQIETNLALLNAHSPVVNSDASSYLSSIEQIFDIIFLDPPFRKKMLPTMLEIIIQKKLLADNGLIYLEHEIEEEFNWNDYGLSLLKETAAGQVRSCFLKNKNPRS